MNTPFNDTGLAAKALELERFLPDGRQPDFRCLMAELFAAREFFEQERADMIAQNRLSTEETARLRERLRRMGRQFELLQDIFRANGQAFSTFRSALTLSRRLRNLAELPEVVAHLGQTMGVRALTCLLSREDFETFVPAKFPCAPREALHAAIADLPGLIDGNRVYVGGLAALPRPEFFFDAAILADCPDLLAGSCFIAPLADKYRPEENIGVLAMGDPDPGRYTRDKGTDFLEHFCEVLAGDLLHVKIHEELTRKRESDELTGIPNRAYLRRHGPPLLHLADRKGAPAALLFCDLDRFKAVNDTYGHEVGDAVLRDVARALAERVRVYDLLARLGGDEFVVLMPDAGAEEAAIMAKRLRACVSRVAKDRKLSGTPGLSVSIGIALHEPGQCIDELVRKADVSMYADKRA
ncbi:MAG: DUF484 family protein [Solidesulfovibrio sp.]